MFIAFAFAQAIGAETTPAVVARSLTGKSLIVVLCCVSRALCFNLAFLSQGAERHDRGHLCFAEQPLRKRDGRRHPSKLTMRVETNAQFVMTVLLFAGLETESLGARKFVCCS